MQGSVRGLIVTLPDRTILPNDSSGRKVRPIEHDRSEDGSRGSGYVRDDRSGTRPSEAWMGIGRWADRGVRASGSVRPPGPAGPPDASLEEGSLFHVDAEAPWAVASPPSLGRGPRRS